MVKRKNSDNVGNNSRKFELKVFENLIPWDINIENWRQKVISIQVPMYASAMLFSNKFTENKEYCQS